MNKIIKVQVWDTAGQERYRSITNAYYRGAEGIMIVFDLTNRESFNSIQNWIEEVTRFTGDDIIIVCLGNKSDLKKSIDRNVLDDFTKTKGIKILEVSAKTGQGVEDAFKFIIEQLIKKNMQEKPESTVINDPTKSNKNTSLIASNNNNENNISCC